jgi:hypothetical protein
MMKIRWKGRRVRYKIVMKRSRKKVKNQRKMAKIKI